MPGMQEIEASVGEASAEALPPRLLPLLVELRPVEHNLFEAASYTAGCGREQGMSKGTRILFGRSVAGRFFWL